MTMIHVLLVGIGGFFGAIARVSVSQAFNKQKSSLPIGTLIVNLVGAFLLGIITGANSSVMTVLLFGTGFMGAFTTFSTFKLEMIQMHLKENKKTFIHYLFITYGLGILLAFLGYEIGSILFS